MNLNNGEYGQKIRINFKVDVSTSTNKAISLLPQRGNEKTSSDNITVGSTNITVDDEKMIANEYIEYTTQAGDIDQAGQWKVRAELELAGVLVKSDYVRFTVLP